MPDACQVIFRLEGLGTETGRDAAQHLNVGVLLSHVGGSAQSLGHGVAPLGYPVKNLRKAVRARHDSPFLLPSFPW